MDLGLGLPFSFFNFWQMVLLREFFIEQLHRINLIVFTNAKKYIKRVIGLPVLDLAKIGVGDTDQFRNKIDGFLSQPSPDKA